ncbi:MAG: endolytic transglycosylase MltG [bacterium]|nr:endolytic transglycosylase MltG [bacterium]
MTENNEDKKINQQIAHDRVAFVDLNNLWAHAKRYPWRNSIGVLAICSLVGFLWFRYEIYLPHPARTGPWIIEIAPGLGSRKIGAALRDAGFIQSKWAFVTYVSLRGEASSLKPGSYSFDNATIPAITRALIKGSANEETITIPEGWSLDDIARYLEERHIVSIKAFKGVVVNGAHSFTPDFSFLAEIPSGAGLEGYLFPDTYRIHTPANPRDIVQKMLENFDRKIGADFRSKNETNGEKRSLFEIITLTSLIEEEVAVPDDRALVAGILLKRLELGIPLQVDATVLYAKRQAGLLAEDTNTLTRDDLFINSPYNTYRHKGLPRGPIANPGLSAIRAALSPTASSYLYYLSTLDGRTIFSRTLDEHNTAKIKYLR